MRTDLGHDSRLPHIPVGWAAEREEATSGSPRAFWSESDSPLRQDGIKEAGGRILLRR